MAKNIKTSYALLGLAFLATACSQEDVDRNQVGQAGGRIAFRVSLPEVSSRAEEVASSTLNAFQVSAFTVGESSETEYFSNQTFRRDANVQDVFFCHGDGGRWPGSSDSLRFIAFSPSIEEMQAAGGGASISEAKLSGLKVARDIESQYDFITAIAGGSLFYNEETGISLRFQHQMSRIFLKAWGNSQIYDLEIAGVRLGGVGCEASAFNLEAGAGTPEALQGGAWENVTNGFVEYIYRAGDVIVKLDGTETTPNESGKAVSILGAKIGGATGYENSAMVIPTANLGWDYKGTPANGVGNSDGKYISVLIRVTDDTPYDTNGTIVYPYEAETLAGNTVWLAADATDGKSVKARLYKNGEDYYADEAMTIRYDLTENGAIAKDFAWAALPVEETFLPGRVYTYTLNYTNGVGLRDPKDSDPGASIINDKVIVNVEVEEWKPGSDSPVTVPRK